MIKSRGAANLRQDWRRFHERQSKKSNIPPLRFLHPRKELYAHARLLAVEDVFYGVLGGVEEEIFVTAQIDLLDKIIVDSFAWKIKTMAQLEQAVAV